MAPTPIQMQKLEIWWDEYRPHASPADFYGFPSELPRLKEAVEGDVLDDEVFKGEVARFDANVRNHFCDACHTLFSNWAPVKMSFRYTRDWDLSPALFSTHGLEASAQQGCKSCTLIRQYLVENHEWETFRKIEKRLFWLGQQSKFALVTRMAESPLEKDSIKLSPTLPGIRFPSRRFRDEPALHSDLIQATDDSSVAKRNGMTRDVSENTRQWLKICTEEHDGCEFPDEHVHAMFLPTRLIFVGSDPPKLALAASLEERPQYATLSHCWGGDIPSKLTFKNLDSRLTSIYNDNEPLPRNFTDAITLTRNVGLEYLWIDSLCIVQDDEEDWKREASLMNSVYGHSTLNIAASSASDSSKGFLLPNSPYIGGFRAKLIAPSGEEVVRDFSEDDLFERAILKSVLASRAWAIQERILPLRTIHLSSRGTIWECNAGAFSEFSLKGLTVRPEWSVRGVSLRDAWSNIVWQYTSANLTKDQDKLPALSGIARRISEETKERYLVGLWQEDFERQLCWCVTTPRERPPWRAGSWSWISVDGPVAAHPPPGERGRSSVYVRMIHAEVTPLGEDPFGQIVRSVIKLRCPGLVVANRYGLEYDDRGALSMTINFGGGRCSLMVKHDSVEDYTKIRNGKSFLLPVYGLSQPDNHQIRGLLLQETGLHKGEFTRVGYFCTPHASENRELWRLAMTDSSYDIDTFEQRPSVLLSLLRKSWPGMAREFCTENTSEGFRPCDRYFVTIV